MTTTNFEAIRAMARNMTELLAAATERCAEAGGVDQAEDQDLLVGTLMSGVRDQLAAALTQYDAIVALHQLRPMGRGAKPDAQRGGSR